MYFAGKTSHEIHSKLAIVQVMHNDLKLKYINDLPQIFYLINFRRKNIDIFTASSVYLSRTQLYILILLQ